MKTTTTENKRLDDVHNIMCVMCTYTSAREDLKYSLHTRPTTELSGYTYYSQ